MIALIGALGQSSKVCLSATSRVTTTVHAATTVKQWIFASLVKVAHDQGLDILLIGKLSGSVMRLPFAERGLIVSQKLARIICEAALQCKQRAVIDAGVYQCPATTLLVQSIYHLTVKGVAYKHTDKLCDLLPSLLQDACPPARPIISQM